MTRAPDRERIAPLEPPYPPEVDAHLRAVMPRRSPVPPLRLFRLWAHHLPLAESLRAIGSYLLKHGSVEPREREIAILRTCARCGAEYEWGVHVMSYKARLGIPDEVVRATRTADPGDPVWSEREALIVRLVDSLHETARVPEPLFAELARHWSDTQLLELLLIAGFYRFVSYTVNATRLALEPWATRFPAG